LAVEVISQQPRRDNAGPDKGGGDPHMNWDDKPLSESETWKSHKSSPATKEQKSGGAVKPPKKQA
jgi:hypothetical protein